MTNCRILVVNGPNLGNLGVREPEIYGSLGMDALPGMVESVLGQKASRIELSHYQGNGEGQIIDRLEAARKDGVDGLALNAGAYTHTSLALADCLAWIGVPSVEVHLSNIFGRTDQPLRQQSLIGRNCIGVIAGFGMMSYALAVCALWQHWLKKNS
ncbi:3-dehydroquinate dehydratase [Fundidesulfovibrio magnetotacticus]|uniref:3-dehydroquinate dehydratase n=1 Tax=Fundidesulfovibrio magnetotacticus TaxID=2730080 RepID=A0A6V8LVA6_9BACT|nr:type II 3-dehydroquinate dehydratase [Fundidesulfovibrio magnetotacticus]GFK94531.1 3-dehydroquinate dehydratase [Fundidesulfovibrio magnetotacticus]